MYIYTTYIYIYIHIYIYNIYIYIYVLIYIYIYTYIYIYVYIFHTYIILLFSPQKICKKWKYDKILNASLLNLFIVTFRMKKNKQTKLQIYLRVIKPVS